MLGANYRKMNVKNFENINTLESTLVKKISLCVSDAIKKYGDARILLSGGSTPINLYSLLSKENVDWEKVKIGLVDERYVPIDDANSNERLIKASLIQNKASKAIFTGMVYDTSNLDKNLDLAIAQNKSFYDETACVLLGMGTDGHTASLFPNDEKSLPGLKTGSDNGLLVYTNSPNEPKQRISFTIDRLLNTKRLFLYFTGAEKMKVFSDAKTHDQPLKLPISSFIHQQQKVLEVFWANNI